MNQKSIKSAVLSFLWDIWCIVSIIGIWPRFIEPKLLFITRLSLPIPKLPKDLNHFKIVQFSDLHLGPSMSRSFLRKISQKIDRLQPDLIVFTGDFLCYSQLHDPKLLKEFLCSFKAPYGCFAILGNHDYASCVSVNAKGEYDVLDTQDSSRTLSRAFLRLAQKIVLAKRITPRAKEVGFHKQLIELLKETPFQLVHNESVAVSVGSSGLNICGLGEYSLGRCQPEEAFKKYNYSFPSIILTHNPDAAPLLASYPGEVILAGHTHGGQVNLPWLWKRFTLLENLQFKRGLWKLKNQWMYVNRGVGSVLNFRWFAVPEILELTLKAGDNG